MFSGLGDAFKNIKTQVDDVVEKTKKDVEELAIEKKKVAQSMIETQVKKTGEAFMHGKADAGGAVTDAKKAAIEAFDKECAEAEKGKEGVVQEATQAKVEAEAVVDSAKEAAVGAKDAVGDIESQIHTTVSGAVKQVGQVVDEKIKEADHFLDEKREEVMTQVKGQAEEGLGSVMGKAKGLLHF